MAATAECGSEMTDDDDDDDNDNDHEAGLGPGRDMRSFSMQANIKPKMHTKATQTADGDADLPAKNTEDRCSQMGDGEVICPTQNSDSSVG